MKTDTLLFVDSQVENVAQLLAHLPRHVEVHWLSADKDGILQIQEALQGQNDLKAIHIL